MIDAKHKELEINIILSREIDRTWDLKLSDLLAKIHKENSLLFKYQKKVFRQHSRILKPRDHQKGMNRSKHMELVVQKVMETV